ncbi:MAG TPA: ABC transporter ATP-binding protein [Candidatus Limnocylindrales bacterium]|nr:ABC transporter ATP-binding protein [Candidatus Limnocylindrales bacterium]
MAEPAVAIGGLTKRYGDRTVVDDVALEVRPGEIVVLLGPNGAGKTTTVEIVEGYRRADGGTVRVLSVDPWGAGRAHRARVGLMLQGGGIDPRARPAETLRQYAAFHRDPSDPAALLAEVGLRDVAATPFRRLSSGERQRLGFALALVGRPDVLVLDEPTAGMDPQVRSVVRARIEAERARGTAVLVTTHELGDAERLADRIAILVAGRIVAAGSAAELAARHPARLRFGLAAPLDDGARRSLGVALGATIHPIDGTSRFIVEDLAPSPALIAALAAWCASEGLLITDTRAAGGTLEDTYLALVGTATATATAGDGRDEAAA